MLAGGQRPRCGRNLGQQLVQQMRELVRKAVQGGLGFMLQRLLRIAAAEQLRNVCGAACAARQ
ncbi:hypothetical protein D3C71_1937440 [compost metagenome]